MTRPLPILYTFRRCPYAMRARLAIYTAKISHEHREVNLKNKPSEMLLISPKGTVPVLQLTDERILEQSLDIMKWAMKDILLSDQDVQLIHENDTVFVQALNRYKYPNRYPEEISTNHRENGELFLKKLEDRLIPFLTGDTLTLLDMAIFPFIRQFVIVDAAWFEKQPYPRLKVWLNSFTSNPLFEEVMQPYLPWSAGDEPVYIKF